MLQLIKTDLFVDAAAAKKKYQSTSNNLYLELIRNDVWDGITVQAYRKRAMILSRIDDFPGTQTESSININTACTVIFLVEKLFQKYLVYNETKICGKCTSQSVRKALMLNVTLQTKKLIKNLKNYASMDK